MAFRLASLVGCLVAYRLVAGCQLFVCCFLVFCFCCLCYVIDVGLWVLVLRGLVFWWIAGMGFNSVVRSSC